MWPFKNKNTDDSASKYNILEEKLNDLSQPLEPVDNNQDEVTLADLDSVDNITDLGSDEPGFF